MGTLPDVPKCIDTGISHSCTASQNGSQWSVWNEGSPSGTGFSGNDTDRAPLAAVRRISAAARWGSSSGTSTRGISRSGAAAHHSSRVQSLYAFTHS